MPFGALPPLHLLVFLPFVSPSSQVFCDECTPTVPVGSTHRTTASLSTDLVKNGAWRITVVLLSTAFFTCVNCAPHTPCLILIDRVRQGSAFERPSAMAGY